MQRLEWQDQVLREMKEGKVEGRRWSAGTGGVPNAGSGETPSGHFEDLGKIAVLKR